MSEDRSHELLSRSLGAERARENVAPLKTRPRSQKRPVEPPRVSQPVPVPARRPAVELTHDQLDSVAALGHMYYEHHHFAEAQVVFAGLMALAPREEYYARGFAAACLLGGDTDGALEAANRAIEIARDPRPALLLRAQVLIARRQLSDAERDLKYILRAEPASAARAEPDPVQGMATMMLGRVRGLLSEAGAPALAVGASR